MDVSNIASLAVAMSNQRTGDAIGVTVLKKALEAQAGGAMALINTLPQPNLPPNLGNSISTTA